jgi:hypothetical protein
MTTSGGPEDQLERARALEESYDWAGSAEVYRSALKNLIPPDLRRSADLYERMGYALLQHAMQADTKGQFRERCTAAIDQYKQASEQYIGDKAKALRCEAMTAYVSYWLAPQFPRKVELLKQAWTLARQSLKFFQQANEHLEYGRTYNQLSHTSYLLFYRGSSFKGR